jgi:hypothetical protein
MFRKLLSFFNSIFIISIAVYSAPDTTWISYHPSTAGDVVFNCAIPYNHDYICAGKSPPDALSKEDLLLLKTSSTGAKSWQKCFGEDSTDVANSLKQTVDNNIIIAGQKGTIEKELSWIIKADTAGSVKWDTCFGQNYRASYFSDIVCLDDSSYIAAGKADIDINSLARIYIVKVNDSGLPIWEKYFGAENSLYYVTSLTKTYDEGFAVTGYYTPDYGTTIAAFIMKLSAQGDSVWFNDYAGSNNNLSTCITETFDRGFAISGSVDLNGNRDALLVLTDSLGTKTGAYNFGTSQADQFNSIWQCTDSGFALAGYNDMYPGATKSWGDGWIFRLDKNAAKSWEIFLKGELFDEICLKSIYPTNDAGYIVSGFKKADGENSYVGLLCKLSNDGSITSTNKTIRKFENDHSVILDIHASKNAFLRIFTGYKSNAIVQIYDLSGRLLNYSNLTLSNTNHSDLRLPSKMQAGTFIVIIKTDHQDFRKSITLFQ